MSNPRYIVRYYKKGESGLEFSSDTEIEVVGAITLGSDPISLSEHFLAVNRLELYIDTKVYDKIKEDYPGYYITPRFSPGYGSIPASDNSKFISLSGCTFITSLASGALYPQYSVVFALGLSKKPQPDHTKCELCNARNCQFRRK